MGYVRRVKVVVGTVTSEVARATLVIGEERHSRQLGDQLVLVVDGVERRLVVATPVVLDKRERADRWSELASDPLAQLFADIAPGDHVKCELSGWHIAPATRVAVSELAGQVMVVAIVEGSDEQARERVTAAAKPQPPPEVVKPVEPPPPIPWRKTVGGMIGVGMIGVAASIIAATASSTAAHAIIVPSVALIAMGVTFRQTRPWFEVVDSVTEPKRFRACFSRGGLIGGATVAFITLDLCGPLELVGVVRPMMPLRLLLLAVLVVFGIIIALRSQRPQRRLAKLLRGPNVLHGTLVASDSPLTRSVRYDVIARTGPNGEAKEYWYDGYCTFERAKPFSLEIDGRRMEVEGQRVLWAAPISYVGLSANQQNSVTVAKTNAQIDPGASVLVLGKPVDNNGVPTFQATGAESFVMFGAKPDARAALQRLRTQWYAGVVFLAALAIGSVAYAVYLGLPEPAPKAPVAAEKPL